MTRTIPPAITSNGKAGRSEDLDLVERAVQNGIISIDQAERMRALVPVASAGPVVTAPRGHLRAYVAEALGYVGAALVLVAGGVIAEQFWADLDAWAQVALLGVLTVVLLSAGAVTHGEPGTPLGRLSGFLWFAAVGATAGTAAALAGEVLELEEAAFAVAVSVPATVVAAVLWALRTRVLQEVAVFAGLVATSVSTLGLVDVSLDDWGGLVVWSLGVAWLVLAWAEIVHPVRTGQVVGAVAVLIGPMTAGGTAGRWGLVLGLVSAGALVAASVVTRETVLLGLGVLGLFVFVPRVVFQFFGEQLGAPVALLVSGSVLLGVALWIARTRRDLGG